MASVGFDVIAAKIKFLLYDTGLLQIQQHHAGFGVEEARLEDPLSPIKAAPTIRSVSELGRRSGTVIERAYCRSWSRNGLVRMNTSTEVA